MRTEQFKRVQAHNPGKHGHLDWRVEVGDVAPTHGEIVFALGMILLAEQRYNGRDDLGPGMLLHFIERVAKTDSPAKIREIAERVERLAP